MTRVVESILKCSKCKSDDLLITELWANSSIVWEQINGKFDRNDGTLNEGNPYKLQAKCKKCKHRWSIRKGFQIDDITK